MPDELCGAAILVVDDDQGTCEIARHALETGGFVTRIATSGREAVAIARSERCELIVIDLRLPDMLGTEVIRTLRSDLITTPFVLLSAFLTTSITVEAMKLGAANVLEKPVSVDELLSAVVSALTGSASLAGPRSRSRPSIDVFRRLPSTAPRSAAERWAQHVAKACASEGDLATLESWARFIGVSCSSLCESCRMLNIHPRDARDFARMLRAVMQAAVHGCSPDVLLDVSDRRTLRHLSERTGLRPDARMSVGEFLDRQRLISPQHEAVRVLRSLLLASEVRQQQ